MSDPSDFFTAGGTLSATIPSYVTRPADDELFQRVQAGEFCYVLTSRQMGKSSLMVRTARRLQNEGLATVLIDLTAIGTVSRDEWYLGLLTGIIRGLRLDTDVQAWWQERHLLSASQRFSDFLHDIVLSNMQRSIAIFIDEIDTTLNLRFRDDFFAAIRSMYNARASDSAFRRLTFVLLGVATPTDLIQDPQRTPFNIGRRIVLQEFDRAQVQPLADGLDESHPGQGDRIISNIFDWTNGHPYLTQKLCLAAASVPADEWHDGMVDKLVEINFLSLEGRKDTNLTTVERSIQSTPDSERKQMLALYRDVYREKAIKDDERSPIQNHLELVGLIRVKQGTLRVPNKLYRQVFNKRWIAANTPQAIVSKALGYRPAYYTLAIVALLIGVWFWVLPQFFGTNATTFTPVPATSGVSELPTIVLPSPTVAPPTANVAQPTALSAIPTITPTATLTPRPAPTDTPSPTPTDTPTPTPTDTPTPTPEPTSTFAPVVVPTRTPRPIPTRTPTTRTFVARVISTPDPNARTTREHRSCVSGRVLGRNGPIEGALLYVNSPGITTEPFGTDRAGNYQRCGLRDATWSIVLTFVPGSPPLAGQAIAVFRVSGDDKDKAIIDFIEP